MSANKPTHSVTMAPREGSKFYPNVGSAWAKKDKNGDEYIIVEIPTLPGALFVRPIREFDNDGPRRPKKVSSDEIDF